MKVLTLNTWQKNGPWKKRWEVLLEELDSLNPDIVAFQEFYDLEWREGVAKRAAFPYTASEDPASSGLVLFSRLPIQESELYRITAKSPFEDYSRYVLRAEVIWNDHRLSVFNTHLSWKIEDEATRGAQVREFWAWIRSHRRSNETILLGDMNATPDSAELGWLRTQSKLVDGFARFHPGDPGFTWSNENVFASEHKPPLPSRRIDHVFVGGEAIVRRLVACDLAFTAPNSSGLFASDHFGVIAEFAD